MAYNYEQDFNALSTADLSTQDSWVIITGLLSVQTGTVYEGAKALGWTYSATTGSYKRAITSCTTSDFYVAIRKTANNPAARVGLSLASEGTYPNMWAGFYVKGTNGNDIAVGNAADTGTQIAYSGAAHDTWYILNIQTQQSTHQQIRGRVYASGAWGSFTSWVNAYNNIDSTDTIVIRSENGGTSGNSFYDKISLTDPNAAASGPANLKSYNTNLKANIKSINTNLIANIKSLDTNV